MQYVIIEESSGKFASYGGGLNEEYPEAIIFDSLRQAKKEADRLAEKYYSTFVVMTGYGLDTDEIVYVAER